MPSRRKMLKLCFARSPDQELIENLKQALMMEGVENCERPPARANFFHRRLILAAPPVRERSPVFRKSSRPCEFVQLADDARSPIHDGSEDIEEEGFNMRGRVLHRLYCSREDYLQATGEVEIFASFFGNSM